MRSVGLTEGEVVLFHRWLLAHLSALMLAVELAWLATVVYLISDGAIWDLLDYPFYFYGGLVVGWLWVLSLLLRHIGLTLALQSSERSWLARLWWAREPVIVAVAIVLFHTPLPLATRLALSSLSLTSVAQGVQAGQINVSDLGGRVIGLFVVREADQVGSAVRFITGPCRLFDDCGLAYSPAGKPPVVGEDLYQHLWGPWWQWARSW